MRLGDSVPSTGRIASGGLVRTILFLSLAFLAGAIGTTSSAEAQPFRADDTFYLKFGAGLSDYAGGNDGEVGFEEDAPDILEFFDTEKFDERPFPYALSGEFGYQFSPNLGIGLGYQFGQYPFASGRPFTVRRTCLERAATWVPYGTQFNCWVATRLARRSGSSARTSIRDSTSPSADTLLRLVPLRG